MKNTNLKWPSELQEEYDNKQSKEIHQDTS